jgi:hypothetical protein
LDATSSPPDSIPTTLSHAEFVTAYAQGDIIVHFDPKAAAKFLSARLLLPLFMMPVLGIGVALALTGWIWTGLVVIALGIIVPRLIKRGAPHFLLQQSLEDAALYQALLQGRVMETVRPARP